MNVKKINRKLINGTDSRYEIVLESIRNILIEFLGEENSLYGCIAFYLGHFDEKQICMKVFPLNPKVIEKNFPDDIELQNKFLQQIMRYL